MMKRRYFLGSTGIITSVTLGGCLDFSDRAVVLERLIVANRDQERGHAIRVSVERDGELVYRRRHSFEAMTDVVAPSDVVEEPFPDESGAYVVTAELLSETSSSIRIDVVERTERECAAVMIEVSRDGQLGGAVLEKCPSDTDREQ